MPECKNLVEQRQGLGQRRGAWHRVLAKGKEEAWPRRPVVMAGGLQGRNLLYSGQLSESSLQFGLDRRMPDNSLIKLSTFLQLVHKAGKSQF